MGAFSIALSSFMNSEIEPEGENQPDSIWKLLGGAFGVILLPLGLMLWPLLGIYMVNSAKKNDGDLSRVRKKAWLGFLIWLILGTGSILIWVFALT